MLSQGIADLLLPIKKIIMKLEHLDQKKLAQDLMGIIGRHLDLAKYQVFFFGSRVTGKSNERSDIDVGIKGKKPIEQTIFSRIKADIDNIRTLYKIDIVDFSDVSNVFKKIAKEKIEIIYPKD